MRLFIHCRHRLAGLPSVFTSHRNKPGFLRNVSLLLYAMLQRSAWEAATDFVAPSVRAATNSEAGTASSQIPISRTQQAVLANPTHTVTSYGGGVVSLLHASTKKVDQTAFSLPCFCRCNVTRLYVVNQTSQRYQFPNSILQNSLWWWFCSSLTQSRGSLGFSCR